MGLIDWIAEPNAERRGQYFDAKYPAEPLPAPTFPCPYCDLEFEPKEALLRHTRTEHPLELPRLFIAGRPALEDEIIRSTINEAAIDFANCSHIELAVDRGLYQTMSEENARKHLAIKDDGSLRLRLTNDRAFDQSQATIKHQLTFRIAPQEEITAINESFISMMQSLPISIASADSFYEKSKNNWNHRASGDYANALATYLIGLAIKEGKQGTEHLNFNSFKEKLSDSLAILSHLDLPLARGLTGIIKLNLNQFGDWRNEAPAFPGLRATGTFFHNPTAALSDEPRKPRTTNGKMSKCPVDDLTEGIIDATLMILEGRTSTRELESCLQTLRSSTPLSEYDSQKLQVLMAVMHLKKGAHKEAGRHLRALRNDINFGAWASGHLDP